MNILDKARRDLAHAEADARRTATAHRSALAKLRAAEDRVRKLEFAAMEAQMYFDATVQRAAREQHTADAGEG